MTLIIPFRSGSKRLKDKNIQKIEYNDGFHISYMFDLVHETAVKSRLFDKIIFAVDKEYEKIVKDAIPYVEVYVRNKKNSRDKSPLIDLVREVKEVYKIKDKYMCIAYTTSILMTEKHLIDAYKECAENDRDCVFPVVKQKLEGTFQEDDFSFALVTEGYKHADAFFIFNLQRALDNNTIISNNNNGFIEIGELEYCDVHTAEDVEILKLKYNAR